MVNYGQMCGMGTTSRERHHGEPVMLARIDARLEDEMPKPPVNNDGPLALAQPSVTAYCAVVSFKLGRNSCVTDSRCPLR